MRDGRRRNLEELGHAYRVADEETWTSWLRRISGQGEPQLSEVVDRRLRVADRGPAEAPPAPAEIPAPVPAAPHVTP